MITLLSSIAELDEWRRRHDGVTVGLVPTMGALHDGHLSLVRAARAECDAVLATVYVNPLQFAPHEDLAAYPRDLQGDLEKLAAAGADALFAAQDGEMYPTGYATYLVQEGPAVTLEGEFRPTHFRGVLTVVCKLMLLTRATHAFFGQKDFQQSVVIRRMVRDLHLPVAVRVCPIVRDSDGLAMSSRNAYLSAEERPQALLLSRSLGQAGDLFRAGERHAERLRQAMRAVLDESGVALDYVEVADLDTLEPLHTIDTAAVALIAARVGATRLIDNCILSEDSA